VSEAVIATTDPRHFASTRQRAALALATDGARLVRYGGDCYCYTQVAMGLVDIVIETGLQPYDIQALIPLIEEAGGVVTSWTGETCFDGGDVLACGDRALHAELVERMRRL
jgi:myo-inositol-1(or 4)-monophosphatase